MGDRVVLGLGMEGEGRGGRAALQEGTEERRQNRPPAITGGEGEVS